MSELEKTVKTALKVVNQFGPTREIKEQSSAIGAWRAADRLIPQSWRRYRKVGREIVPENLWARFVDRLEKKVGY